MFSGNGPRFLGTILIMVTAGGVASGDRSAAVGGNWPARLSGRVSDRDEVPEPAVGAPVSLRIVDDQSIADNQGDPRVPSQVPPSELPQVDVTPLTCGGCDDLECPGCTGNDSDCGPLGVVDDPWCANRCDDGWFRNSLLFFAGDGWKNIFDDDDNNNFGFRAGFNVGFDLPGSRAVRGQAGMSFGGYDFHGREGLLSRDDPIEQQYFATAGIYKRSDVASQDRLAWGAVYDLLVADEAGERTDSLRLGQWRSYIGFALRENDEIGVWTAFRLMRDYAPAQGVMVNTTDQANLFWHHHWRLGGDTTGYVGWADDPGSVVLGLNGRVPLNDRAALFGNVHYILPSTTGGDIHPTLPYDDVFNQEAWNVSFGIVFFTGAKAAACNVSGQFGLPLLPVADNGTLSYQAPIF